MILILICSCNVALPPDAYFPNVPHDLCFWDPCLPHWHSQAYEAWYSIWYVDHDFGPHSSPFLLGELIHSPARVDPYGYKMGTFIAHYREADSSPALTPNNDSELEKPGKGNDFEGGYTLDYKGGSERASLASDKNAMAQLIAVAVLEFGIILHRYVLPHMSRLFYANLPRPACSALIGLTLAMDNRWRVLFVAVLFYRMHIH